MFKKLSLVLLGLLTVLTLTACDNPEEVSDWDVIREIRDNITFDETDLTENLVLPTIENEDVTVSWVSSNPSYLTDEGVITRPGYIYNNQNASMTLTIQLGDAVLNTIFNFTVLAEDRPEVIELNTNETDNLALDFAYESTDFIADGVGEATLVRCVDGDTAIFTEGGENFSVRFLGINTPESTAKFEPWGKAASDFTCDKLTNASTIVLQADPASGRLDSYGTRYLAWVWYDGRLLNLELVEQAYSLASGSTDTLYGTLIFNTNLVVQFTERRVWGEVDPDYDYSLEGIQISVEELVTNYSEYIGKKVVITGIVSRKLGGAAFIQQGDYGVYIYNRQWAPDLSVGNEVLLSGLTVNFYPDEGTGALQVSNYRSDGDYSQVLSRDNTVDPTTISVEDITSLNVGSLLKVENLTVQSIYEGDDSFTITAVDSSGNTITVRKDAAASDDITVSMFQVGTTFTVVAPLSRYMSTYQLMLTSVDDVTIIE
jgi:micrococcal nuclease